jgi:GNAT superfamily N-acetyltransferase
MGEDYIVGANQDDAGIKLAIKCWPGRMIPGRWPNPSTVAYFKKVMDAYGTSAITAWQEEKLVGFLPFMPVNCGLPEMVFCVSAPNQTPEDRVASSTTVPFDELTPKILKVQCLSVSPRLYRKGIGTAMVHYLADWAGTRGWQKIQGWAFESPEIDDSYVWLPSVQFWEKSGFQRANARVFDPTHPGTNKPGFDFSIELQNRDVDDSWIFRGNQRDCEG